MDRTKYLKKCQLLSVKYHIAQFSDKQKTISDCIVMFDGGRYYAYAYAMRFEKGEPIDIAILRDKKTDTTIYAKLKDVYEVDS